MRVRGTSPRLAERRSGMRLQRLERVGSLGNRAALRYSESAVSPMPHFPAIAFWLPRSSRMNTHMARIASASLDSSRETSLRILLLTCPLRGIGPLLRIRPARSSWRPIVMERGDGA